MPNDPKTEFIANLKKSGVIDADRLAEWLDVTTAETAGELAKYLVRDELLTKWQAKYLLSGRSRLEIASYQLLDRTSRDKLGDRFLAVHTSLARKVDLQVFSSELTKDKSRCKPFLKKSSQIAKLDHPNLVHAYDIDQEGGRYFLVTEHIDGTTLDEIPRTQITEDDIARILDQALKGITHAHENDIVHGCLKQTDLILVDKRHLKIQNLAVSPLRKNSETEPKSDFKAIKKIAVSLLKEIPEKKRTEKYRDLVKLLNAFDYKDPESIEATSAALTTWVGSNELADGEVDLASSAPFSDDLFSTAGSPDSLEGSFDKPSAGVVGKSLRKKKPAKPDSEDDQSDEEDQDVSQPGFAGRLWQNNPVAFIATAALLGLALIGGSGFGIYSYFNPASSSVVAAKKDKATEDKALTDVANKPSASKERAKKSAAEKQKNTQQVDVTKFSNPVLKTAYDLGPFGDQKNVPARTPVRFIGEPSGGWVDIEVTLPNNEVTSGSIDLAMIVEADDVSAASAAAITSVTAENPPAEELVGPGAPAIGFAKDGPPKLAMNEIPTTAAPNAPVDRVNGIGPATKEFFSRGGVNTLKQLAELSVSDVQAALKKGGMKNPSRDEEYKKWIVQAKKLIGDKSSINAATSTKSSVASAKPQPKPKPKSKPKSPAVDLSTPFKNFPRLTDLPAITDTKEFQIAPLKINQSYLLGAEMICEPGVSKTKLIFDMTRTPEDKQKWNVGVKRRAKETPAIIATFRKSSDAFFFQWLPEAAENSYSEFLRNCYVKLKTPDDETTFLTLRKPIKVPDFRYFAKNMSNARSIDIPALPNVENIVIELLPPRVKDLQLIPVSLQIEPRQPGKIELRRNDRERGMWIQIAGGIRNKLELQTNVMAMHQGQEAPMASLEDISNFIGNLKKIESQMAAINNAAQSQQLSKREEQNNGLKSQLNAKKREAEKLAKQASEAVKKAIEYKDILSKAANQPLHVRVYAKFGNLQTQLVETDAKLPQPEPESKKKKKKKKRKK